jgi:hypothetical protein
MKHAGPVKTKKRRSIECKDNSIHETTEAQKIAGAARSAKFLHTVRRLMKTRGNKQECKYEKGENGRKRNLLHKTT